MSCVCLSVCQASHVTLHRKAERLEMEVMESKMMRSSYMDGDMGSSDEEEGKGMVTTSFNFKISWNPLLYRILAGQSSLGKLCGPQVKTSALVSKRSWVRILPESPVKFFHRHSECTEYAVLYTRRCRSKLNKLFITRRKNFINL